MNIYLLNATETAFLPAHVLVKGLHVKGLIGLNNNKINSTLNEYYDYSAFCSDNHIDYISLNSYSMNDPEDKERLLALEIDILLVISWQRLIPDWLISHCRIGAVGAHGSPLGINQGRGRSPQNWALLLGCRSFSYSIFWIDPGIDSGEIIDTCEFAYTETDDIMTSYIKAGLSMTKMIVDSYHNGNLARHYGRKQDDGESFYFPQRTREDGLIDWHKPARFLYDFVRALTKPYPGAYTMINGQAVTIWAGKYIDCDSAELLAAEPGRILLVYPNGEILVSCGEGLFLITIYDVQTRDVLTAGAQFDSADFEVQLQGIVDRHNAKYSYEISPLITDLLPGGADK